MANTGLTVVKQAVGYFFNSLLKRPGDHLEARVTDTGRQVIKAATEEVKYSATRYPSTGTVVETRVTRPKK